MFASITNNEQQLDELVRGFEDGTWPIAKWTHVAHLTVAASYIVDDPETALDRLRTNIPRYNVSQGGVNTIDSGYHETLTCFWHSILCDYLDAQAPASRLELVNKVVEEFANQRDLYRDYYDFDVVKSREARARWVPPV